LSPDIDKFARKVSRILQDKLIDKKARAKTARNDRNAAFHDGFAAGYQEAISVVRSIAERWEP